ncbi:MAG TPA: CHAT domain-containing protein, partial [Burkholderiales bacterium]|nr:CHAT domain-containing protein [Burkholderiales bacterium]
MRSLLLEFLRLNNLKTGMWREGDPYLVAAGAEYPIRQFNSPLDQESFLDLTRELRYQGDAEKRLAALKEIGEIAANLLGSHSLGALSSASFPLQLDLVVNPAEVAALPFEAATDGKGAPLFARADPAVVLTRRVRGAFAEASVRWPAKPRLLYAWAAPPGAGDVPSAEHEAALRRALGPWMAVQQGDGSGAAVIATLAKATLAQLEKACRTAVEEKKPFTHVHFLAHGYPVGEAHKQHFGMALHDEGGDLHAATPEEIEQALKPLVGHTVVVTLATCDAANLTNTITSKRSIAHGLHELGFPVVVASQFPFTVPGSNLMVETFYKALLGGQDVRIALHQARLALYEKRQMTGHDWASLVGYVRLPEGYADHLLDVRLESVLASLKTIQGWSDSLVKQGGKDAALFEHA